MAVKASGKRNTKATSGRTKKSARRKRDDLKKELRAAAGVESKADVVRFVFGMMATLMAIFLFLAIISNFFTGAADQAGVESGAVTRPANYAGTLGAYAGYYLMHNLFGVFSIFIPVFLSAFAVKLFAGDPRSVRLWKVCIHLTIITVLGSVDAAFVQHAFLPEALVGDLPFDFGGLHGKIVLEWLIHYIGQIPSGIVLAILTLAYVGYWFIQVLITLFTAISSLFRWILSSSDDGDEEDEEDQYEGAHESGGGEILPIESKNEDSAEASELSDGLPVEPGQLVSGAEESPISIELNPTTEDSSAEETPSDDDATEQEPMSEEDFRVEVSTNENADEELQLDVEELREEDKAGAKTVADVDELGPYDPRADLSRYRFPPLSLLEKHDVGNLPIDMEEQNANKNRIIEVLGSFDVKISRISATVGPTVTLYEITPAPGVRIAKIKNLQDDIALSLAASGIRIIAPIPGKGTIGIEVPNQKPQIVSMESIINTQKFRDTAFELPIALGKTITNEVFMVDLAKMPHLLVAGATGQGKSVGLNAIITSLLYKKHPAELKLVMVDPKKVEFSMYNPIINHFLAQVPDSDEPVITDVKKVVQTLKSLCQEMDDRYDLLKRARCKNIKEYNAKFISRHLNPNDGHRFLPYVVVIIDEFGDLIMTAGKDIELPIARIAQLARAVGMHMIIATQTPRATIITGKIKANFPARMAFKVSGRVESQTILDRPGANNLIGRGDMLFMAGSEITRVQCAFVDTPEIEKITNYVSQQQAYPYPYELPLVAEEGGEGTETFGGSGGSTFEQVAHFVVSTGQGSTSKIQRTFSIGFNRAGRLMDQLEEVGIVGPVNGSKPREVYVQSEMELQQILEQLKAQGKKFE